ncbi:MAG TPA: hypothetical protein PK767_09225 [Clostridiales bacterium]|nr:hypothetical protein [Clostridiales bacterium]HOL92532.1 hypothetical protein [Clostridiales bacterium]HPP36407.1 hypothetical protein [Clostridiales bacterium]
MRTDQLLMSGLDITEDNYIFKGQFILSSEDKSKHVDMEELEKLPYLEELKKHFDLEESPSEIRNILIDMVVEKAKIGSKIREGKNLEELHTK